MRPRFQPPTIKQQELAKDRLEKNKWTLGYRLKGMAVGVLGFWFYAYAYSGDYSWQIFLAAAVVGYFLGWLVGTFFYTKKT